MSKPPLIRPTATQSPTSPGRVIAIGDLHGCRLALDALLAAIVPQPHDTLVVLGDCVDRGPDTRGVIERLRTLDGECRLVCLLGNHEEMLLDAVDGSAQTLQWLDCGGTATLASYGVHRPESLPGADLQWFRQWVDWYATDTHFFVHGSYDPHIQLDRQNWSMSRWQTLRAGIPEPHVSGRIAVVGHTAQKTGEILDVGHLLCIDTYCHGGGWLTAYDATTGAIWQANLAGELRKRS